jgi:hypothetical protein
LETVPKIWGTLKANSFLPPVLASAIALGWIGTQRRTISSLESDNAELAKSIASARSAGTEGGAVAERLPGSARANDKGPVDWKKFSAELAEMQQNRTMGDMRSTIRIQQKLMSMSREELARGMVEIAALDLPQEQRLTLQQMVLGPLIQKDPQFALTHFSDFLGDDRMGLNWQFAGGLKAWGKKDATGAETWLDQQIAAGKFVSKKLDGSGGERNHFEGSMVSVLLGTDPDAAGRRLAAIPEDQRADVLSQFSFREVPKENQLAYAELVRETVPVGEQARTLAQQAAQLGGDDQYEKVTGFLDRIQATTTERDACVTQAAETQMRTISNKGKITTGDLDTMREWATKQAPESVDKATGKALSTALQGPNKLDFQEAADLAVKYNQAGSSDDVLAGFLEGWQSGENKVQARKLAERIGDETRRNQILERLK